MQQGGKWTVVAYSFDMHKKLENWRRRKKWFSVKKFTSSITWCVYCFKQNWFKHEKAMLEKTKFFEIVWSFVKFSLVLWSIYLWPVQATHNNASI